MNGVNKDVFGITVEGRSSRSLLPQQINEIGRFDVRLKSGANVEGGVFAREIQATGPFQVSGPVLASGSIICEATSGISTVKGPVVAMRSFTAKITKPGVCRIVGDVSSQRVNLDGVVIYGNLIGANVTVRNSLIFGMVTAAEDLEIDRCTCMTFTAARAKVGADVALLCGGGGAEQDLTACDCLELVDREPSCS